MAKTLVQKIYYVRNNYIPEDLPEGVEIKRDYNFQLIIGGLHVGRMFYNGEENMFVLTDHFEELDIVYVENLFDSIIAKIKKRNEPTTQLIELYLKTQSGETKVSEVDKELKRILAALDKVTKPEKSEENIEVTEEKTKKWWELWK